VEREVEAIRGLKFKQPVDYNVLDRQEIKQTIAGKLDEVFTPQEFSDMAAGLSALGLLPPAYPLRQSYIDLSGNRSRPFTINTSTSCSCSRMRRWITPRTVSCLRMNSRTPFRISTSA
jgi:hypothetical protein